MLLNIIVIILFLLGPILMIVGFTLFLGLVFIILDTCDHLKEILEDTLSYMRGDLI